MKVLISAFECFPNKGSEAGVGWNWGCQLALRGHQVWVVTGGDSKEKIDAAVTQGESIPPNLHFIYFDLLPLGIWGKDNLRLVRTHNYIWQLLLPFKIYRLNKHIQFDLAHHLTWGVIRSPSLLGLLGIPLVFGPAGGGERSPWRFTRGMSLHGKLREVARTIANKLIWVDPFMWLTFLSTDRIYARTSDSKHSIPPVFHHKTFVHQEIGIHPIPKNDIKRLETYDGSLLRLVFAGRLIHVKGMHLGFEALAKSSLGTDNIKLTIIGDGPEKNRLQSLAKELDIDSIVEWLDPVPQQMLFKMYKNYDALLYPSLHDSGGNAVMEAIAHGLPVICLDLGGPPQFVGSDCGIVVPVGDSSIEQVVSGLSQAILEMLNVGKWKHFSTACVKKGARSKWSDVVQETYLELQRELPLSLPMPHRNING